VIRMPTHSARAMCAAAALALLASPVSAQSDSQSGDDQKPVTDQTVTAKDVGMTPIKDLNLKKDPIPPLLIEASKDPYATNGLRKCDDYASAVRDLDAVLGVDYDIATPEERQINAGRVAEAVVGSLIPFRGVIREVSGASKHQREFREAILAGMMRRSFLKGMGLKLGCAYPARPADPATKARIAALAEQQAKEEAERKAQEKADKKKDKGS
jgi:hypothetical protein